MVSRELKIPLSTLYDWKQNPDIKLGGGRPPVFSVLEERLIVEAIMYASNMGFPQTREDLCDMIQQYVHYSLKRTPFNNGRPGYDWLRGFEKRHRCLLRRRSREGISDARADALSQENTDEFLKIYKLLADLISLYRNLKERRREISTRILLKSVNV